jgi:ornithine cyclodeaminase
MTKIIQLAKINEILESIDPVQIIEEGFVAYSQGKVVVPPVGEMIFDNPEYPGDCHIKYGFIRDDDYYVVKIAQGFYNNPKLGLPAINGLNILFNQKNGAIECILLDEGHLTNIRTASAGTVAAKYMAPKKVRRIGIFGTGIQGKLQLRYLKSVVDCREAIVWGRNQEGLDAYIKSMTDSGFNIVTTTNPEDITSTCNLIVTCTPTKTPLIQVNQIQKGTHITAMGSDTPEKQEIDSAILQKADKVITDSISQSESRGECFQAIKSGYISKEKLIELGTMISNEKYQRTSDDEITVVDLTGVAVQDIQISKAVYKGYKSQEAQ